MGNCQSYDNCIKQTKDDLEYPIDRRSLYVHRIHDNQTANRRCYEKNPIDIIEGFGFKNFDMKTILRWIIIIMLICVIVFYGYKFLTQETVKLGINTEDLIGGSDTQNFINNLFSEI